MIIIAKWIIHEFALFISTKYIMDVPDKAYHICLVEFITNGTPAITMHLMLQYLIFLYLFIYRIYQTLYFFIFFYNILYFFVFLQKDAFDIYNFL